jgi:hypothetical protein
VQKLVDAFSRLRATDYADAGATAEQLGLAPPRARLTLTKKDGQAVVFALGSFAEKKAHLAVTGDPVVYRVPASTAELMQPNAEAFFEPATEPGPAELVAAEAAAKALQQGGHAAGLPAPQKGHGADHDAPVPSTSAH